MLFLICECYVYPQAPPHSWAGIPTPWCVRQWHFREMRWLDHESEVPTMANMSIPEKEALILPYEIHAKGHIREPERSLHQTPRLTAPLSWNLRVWDMRNNSYYLSVTQSEVFLTVQNRLYKLERHYDCMGPLILLILIKGVKRIWETEDGWIWYLGVGEFINLNLFCISL